MDQRNNWDLVGNRNERIHFVGRKPDTFMSRNLREIRTSLRLCKREKNVAKSEQSNNNENIWISLIYRYEWAMANALCLAFNNYSEVDHKNMFSKMIMDFETWMKKISKWNSNKCSRINEYPRQFKWLNLFLLAFGACRKISNRFELIPEYERHRSIKDY